jgi:hypothetical protein
LFGGRGGGDHRSLMSVFVRWQKGRSAEGQKRRKATGAGRQSCEVYSLSWLPLPSAQMQVKCREGAAVTCCRPLTDTRPLTTKRLRQLLLLLLLLPLLPSRHQDFPLACRGAPSLSGYGADPTSVSHLCTAGLVGNDCTLAFCLHYACIMPA